MPTYYVRSSGGNDGNDGLSFGNGWATVQHAADTVIAGDTVLVCADGNHTPSLTIDFDATTGTSGSRITFRGAGATGDDDGTVATISGSSLGAGFIIDATGSIDYVDFENLRITGGPSSGFNQQSGSAVWSFRNCRFDNNTNYGFISSWSTGPQFYDCEFDNNGSDGLAGYIAGAYRCSFHDNTGDGYQAYTESISFCVSYDNGNDGFRFDSLDSSGIAHNLTSFGNGSDGIYINSSQSTITNSIVFDNGAYGINATATGQGATYINICSHSNTTAHCNWNGGTIPGSGHVLEDPSFVSVTDGAEDLTPQNTNLYKTITMTGGTSYEYIGAIQPQASAGGDKYPYPRARRY